MDNQSNNQKLIHNFDSSNTTSGIALPLFGVFVIVALLIGVTIGFAASKMTKKTSSTTATATTTSNEKPKAAVGLADKKTFKDSAEGLLKEGGIDGEGSFHLERPGGTSQNVYLTSSTVDLSQYIGKKVRVWGATFQAQKAGWLMDVGLVEILQ